MRTKFLAALSLTLILAGCTTVDVTKTGRGYHAPTNPNDVDILFTKPDRKYVELGELTVTGWKPSDTAKMNNSLRAKAAPLGADAVIILNSGLTPTGSFGSMQMWATGVAIKYTTGKQ